MDRRRVLLIVAVVVAALGAGLVLFYAQGAEDRAEAKVERTAILVVTQQINPGELASDAADDGKIQSIDVPVNEQLTGHVTENTAADELGGKFALTTLYPGEQVLTQKFGSVESIESEVTLPIPEGMVAKPVALDDVSRVAGFTQPGSRVGMFVTGTFDGSDIAETRLLLDQVTILATGSTSVTPVEVGPDGNTTAPVDPVPFSQYTLALLPRDAARVTLAQTLGSLSLVLLPPDAKLEVGDSIDAGTLFDE